MGFPAARFQNLSHAPEKKLKELHIEINGHALRWEELDGFGQISIAVNEKSGVISHFSFVD